MEHALCWEADDSPRRIALASGDEDALLVSEEWVNVRFDKEVAWLSKLLSRYVYISRWCSARGCDVTGLMPRVGRRATVVLRYLVLITQR